MSGESDRTIIDIRIQGPNALRVEYERDDISANGDGWVANLPDYPSGESLSWHLWFWLLETIAGRYAD